MPGIVFSNTSTREPLCKTGNMAGIPRPVMTGGILDTVVVITISMELLQVLKSEEQPGIDTFDGETGTT